MVLVVRSELRQQNGPHDGPDLSLPVLQGSRVALTAAGVLARVKVLVPANELLDVLTNNSDSSNNGNTRIETDTTGDERTGWSQVQARLSR